MSNTILRVEHLSKFFDTKKGKLHAVDDISFTLEEGKTLGIVGESGCGKSTTGRVILRLLEPTGGKVYFDGKDMSQFNSSELRKLRQDMQIIFQDPFSSLDPRMTTYQIISEPIIRHKLIRDKNELSARVYQLMDTVGLAQRFVNSYPHELDGGRRQRIGIARALALNPRFIVCDEPVSALDVSIQAQILKLIKDLQKEFGYTIVFITHDLGVVSNIADRVAVLYAGQIVELGTVEEVFYDPRHPYTWAMLSSLPQLAQRNTELYSITGTPPSLYNTIVGDPFAPRNPYCLKIDTLMDAPMFQVSPTHFAKTWLLDPRAPKIEKPEAIQNLHEKLLAAFNI